MVEVNTCLKQLDNKDIADYEHNQLMRRLRQLIAQSWHTDEIRKLRPSPVDEAKWGFAVVVLTGRLHGDVTGWQAR